MKKTSTKLGRCRNRPRRGAIIILIAFLLPVLFVLVGFSVDMANMQRTRTELRTATDLAAKAAAESLARTGDATQAIAAGKQIANANLVAGDGLTLVDSDFEFGVSAKMANGKYTFTPGGANPNSVRITGSRTSSATDGPVALHFGNFIGQSSFEPTVTAAAAFLDVDICLVLDRSSSMKKDLTEGGGLSYGDARWCQAVNGASRWRDLDTAVRTFLDELKITPGQENVAMVTFGGQLDDPPGCGGNCDYSTITVDQDLTTNITAIEDALTSRTSNVWNGMTDIHAGMVAGINVMANARPNAMQVIILFTDGQYTEANPVPTSLTAANNGIIVHTVTFGPLPTDPDDTWITDMEAIATNTGGRHLHAPTKQALQDAFEELAATIAILIQ